MRLTKKYLEDLIEAHTMLYNDYGNEYKKLKSCPLCELVDKVNKGNCNNCTYGLADTRCDHGNFRYNGCTHGEDRQIKRKYHKRVIELLKAKLNGDMTRKELIEALKQTWEHFNKLLS